MFITRKTRAAKAYAIRMLLSFKVLLTYQFVLISHRTTVSAVKQISSDKTRLFVGHCPMSVANTQSCVVWFRNLNDLEISIFLNK